MKSISVEDNIKACLENECRINLMHSSEVCKKNGFSFGVAVSGGADSVCLLISLCNILASYKIPLKVISVNHFIRADEETCGDVNFVKEVCNQLKEKGFNVSFFVEELKRGLVAETSENRKMGTEEAARFLRYQAFERFIQNERILYLCLAHNKNDFYETVLMRFLQGSSCDSFSGISYVRNKYVRPLLNVERNEIEEYLNQRGQKWRTDSTNFDASYLRNKIRNKLMPFLSENFEGWKTAVEKGAEKADLDRDFIADYVNQIFIESDDKGNVFVEGKEFLAQKRGIQIRLLLKMANHISENCRIPFNFLNEVCDAIENINNHEKGINGFNSICEKSFSDLQFFWKENKVCVKKMQSLVTDYCFSDIISKSGSYEYDWGSVEVTADEKITDLFTLKLKFKSGKTDKIKAKLPYQLIVNHL